MAAFHFQDVGGFGRGRRQTPVLQGTDTDFHFTNPTEIASQSRGRGTLAVDLGIKFVFFDRLSRHDRRCGHFAHDGNIVGDTVPDHWILGFGFRSGFLLLMFRHRLVLLFGSIVLLCRRIGFLGLPGGQCPDLGTVQGRDDFRGLGKHCLEFLELGQRRGIQITDHDVAVRPACFPGLFLSSSFVCPIVGLYLCLWTWL